MIINISDLPIFENIPISRDEDYNTLGPDEQMQLYDVGPKEHIKPAKIWDKMFQELVMTMEDLAKKKDHKLNVEHDKKAE